ncbi:MAG: hypothetical protein R2762_09815 [Bryobacteraceae bacterium]
MSDYRLEELDFVAMATSCEAPATDSAPAASSRLRARLLTAMLRKQAETGPLLSLAESKARGGALCVFEELVVIAPVGESNRCKNPCNVCHARVLAERMEPAPIWWPGCPYADYQKG